MEVKLTATDSSLTQATLDQACMEAMADAEKEPSEVLNKVPSLGACAAGGKSVDDPVTGDDEGFRYEISAVKY